MSASTMAVNSKKEKEADAITTERQEQGDLSALEYPSLPMHTWKDSLKNLLVMCLLVAAFKQVLMRLCKTKFAPIQLQTGSAERVERAVLYFLSTLNCTIGGLYSLLEDIGFFTWLPKEKALESQAARDYVEKLHLLKCAVCVSQRQNVDSDSDETSDTSAGQAPSKRSQKTVRFDAKAVKIEKEREEHGRGCKRLHSPPRGARTKPLRGAAGKDENDSDEQNSAALCEHLQHYEELLPRYLKRWRYDRQAQRAATYLELMNGYMFHDFLCILPQAAQYPADILHHIIGHSMSWAVVQGARNLGMFVPLALKMEFSTVLLNLMWFFREFEQLPKMFPRVDKALPPAFAVIFFLIRILVLPPLWIKLGSEHPRRFHEGLGTTGTLGLTSLQGLNFYWFCLIVDKLRGK